MSVTPRRWTIDDHKVWLSHDDTAGVIEVVKALRIPSIIVGPMRGRPGRPRSDEASPVHADLP
jgi:hypothetical protein